MLVELKSPKLEFVVLTFFAAAFSVWAACFPVRRELHRRKLIDRPNERSSHVLPTPRGGGLAIMPILLVGMVLVALLETDWRPLILSVCALSLGIISFIDDVEPVSVRYRFAAHCLAGMVVLIFLWWTDPVFDFRPVSLATQLIYCTLLVAWIVGYTNAFNFMDGINGIAGLQAVITGIGTAGITGLALKDWSDPLVFCSLLIAGTALGFLPHNFPKARMFMGDVGSAPLGFLLASISAAIALAAGFSIFVSLLLLHVNFILDTGITLSRRILRGEPFYKAHNEHFYQRLVRAGKSHTFVTSLEMSLQLVTLLFALLYLRLSTHLRMGVIAVVVLLWLLFFAYAEALFRRVQRHAGRGLK